MSDDTEEPEDGSQWDGRNTSQENGGERKRGRPKNPLTQLRASMRRELDELTIHDAPSIYRVLKEGALKGDMAAIRTLLERIWPARRGAEIESICRG